MSRESRANARGTVVYHAAVRSRARGGQLRAAAEAGSWLDSQTFFPKSPLGQAATCTLNLWDALCRYDDDGELTIDNNRAERAMRPLAIGRKNWLLPGIPPWPESGQGPVHPACQPQKESGRALGISPQCL